MGKLADLLGTSLSFFRIGKAGPGLKNSSGVVAIRTTDDSADAALSASTLTLSGNTASRLMASDASKNVASLSTSTYPSLTEISYVKGVTSALQTQIDLKAPLSSPAFTDTPTAPTATINTNTAQLATCAFAVAQVNAAVVGLWDDRGNYDASGNVFPSSGGSGSAGAVLKGDIWTISVAGTLGGTAVVAGDTVRALADTPGQTAANWAIAETAIGYTPENSANKSTDGAFSANSDTLYPSQKAAKTYADTKQPLDATLTALAGLATGANKIAYSTGTDTFSQTDFTAAGRALVGGADAAAQRTTLGLGTLATQSGTFSGTSSGTNTGDQTSVSGNAGTATALQTARTIGGVSFDGTANITVSSATAGFAVSGGNLTADTTTLVVDATNHRVGIGTATPLSPLAMGGSAAGRQVSVRDYGAGNDHQYEGLGRDTNQLIVQVSGSTVDTIWRYGTSGSTSVEMMRLYGGGGLTVGAAPTGGNKGAGTINISGDIYKNNTAYTNPDYVIELWQTGKIEKFKDNPGAKGYKLLTLAQTEKVMRQTLRLPGMPSEPMGSFARDDFLLEKLEEAFIHIIELNKKIDKLRA